MEVELNPWGKSKEGLSWEERRSVPAYNPNYLTAAMHLGLLYKNFNLDWHFVGNRAFTIVTQQDQTDLDWNYLYKAGHWKSLQGFTMHRTDDTWSDINFSNQEEALEAAGKHINQRYLGK